MKILLTTLNSKFIHSNLAIRYLKAFCPEFDIYIKEYTINDNLNSIISDIYSQNCDVVAFSCYIWNIDMTLKAAYTLKNANNNIKIILGGPEVSYCQKELLLKHNYIDYVISGEGEITFKELINALQNNNDLHDIDGLSFREKGQMVINKSRKLIEDLDIINFPYQDNVKNKIVYYESSRGCPFNCQYCLSSTTHGVRYFSMQRVKSDLKKLIDMGVSQVKFVDRTFNCNKQRTLEILKYLIELNPSINFHFEVNAELLDDEVLNLLSNAPKGLFQFEIGVQSTNPKTLKAISRNYNLDKISYNVKKLRQYNNIHLHLDLIAGLPKESYVQFKESFDFVYNLKPHMLQLGFLKLLKGCELREKSEEYGIKYNNYTPYEVISTQDMSFEDLTKLKNIEQCLEKYYNCGRFEKILDFIMNNLYNSPFEFFEDLSEDFKNNNLFSVSHSTKQLYTILNNFLKKNFEQYMQIINDLLKFDYLLCENNFVLPKGIYRTNIDIRKEAFEFLKQPQMVRKYLPNYEEFSPKQIIKNVHFEIFEYNVLSDLTTKLKQPCVILFDYHIKIKSLDKAGAFDVSQYFNLK